MPFAKYAVKERSNTVAFVRFDQRNPIQNLLSDTRFKFGIRNIWEFELPIASPITCQYCYERV